MERIAIRSTAPAEDGALTALADVAEAVVDWSDCRIVGGQMVAVHVSRSGIDIAHRPTADADLAAPLAVLADPGLADRLLRQRGYHRIDGSRLVRSTPHGDAVIDLLGPAPASRTLHNRPAGVFTVDAVAGIHYALTQPPVTVRVDALLYRGHRPDPFVVAVPTVQAAIVVKATAAMERGAQKDRADLDLLLEVAAATRDHLPAPPYDNLDVGRAAEFLHDVFAPAGPARRRALVAQVIPRPPAHAPFLDL